MRQSDQLALEIFQDLKRHFFVSGREYGCASTIVGLFFHDLMIHFTGVLIHREASKDYGSDFIFPFVNQAYARQPFEIFEFPRQNSRLDGGFFSNLVKKAPLLPFGIGQAIPMSSGRDRLEKIVLSVLGFSHSWSEAYLVRREEQVGYLSDVIYEICTKYSISNCDEIISNWVRYVQIHTTSDQKKIAQNSVILGTRCQLHNRKLAFNYLQQNKQVWGFTHGEVANAAFDEPTFSYADCSFCTILVDYGDPHTFGQFNSPLIEPKKFFRRTSTTVKKISSQTDAIDYFPKSSSRLLYIPTMYSANKLYGPFRNIEDEKYRKWQKIILDNFPDLTGKTHPKSLVEWGYQCKTEPRPLTECMSKYDGIILDYCSTASTLAFSTDRPILYFDLGLRNLTALYKNDVIKRCHYIEISTISDSEKVKKEIVETLKNQSQKSNTQMMKYSITTDSSDSILLDMLQSNKNL